MEELFTNLWTELSVPTRTQRLAKVRCHHQSIKPEVQEQRGG